MDLTQKLLQQLQGGGLSAISQQVGLDESSTQQAISAAVPILVSALANNASQPGGADVLHQALQSHDGGILDDVIGYISGGGELNGASILSHVLGGQQTQVQSGIAKHTGLDLGTIAKLLPLLAPLVMGLIGKNQKQNGFDPGALSGYLNGQRQQAEETSPDLMGALSGLLGGGSGSAGGLGALGDLAKKMLGD